MTYTSTGSIGSVNTIPTVSGYSGNGFATGLNEVVVSGVTHGIVAGYDLGSPDVAWSFDINTPTVDPRNLGDGYNLPTYAYGVNASGLVCGSIKGLSGASTGFTCTYAGFNWDKFPADYGPGSSQLYAVNVNGISAGVDDQPPSGFPYAAVLVSGAWALPGSISGVANGINDNSKYAICGNVQNGSTTNGFYYDTNSSTYNQLGSSTIAADALGVNRTDKVVGWFSVSSPAPTNTHAFICTSGTTMTDFNSTTVVPGLDTTNTILTSANAINNNGDIVGEMFVDTKEGMVYMWEAHGFLLTPI